MRNLFSLGRSKPLPIFIWIPPTFGSVYKVEIVSSGVAYDITDVIISGEYSDGVTETIGNFNIKFDNSGQDYTSLFSLYDSLNIYMDYSATATTKRFVGRIERISKSESNVVIIGKSMAAVYIGKNITYSATNTARSTILSGIITKYFNSSGSAYTGSDLTVTNLESDTGVMTVNYVDKPFMEVVEEICFAGSRDSYIDINGDFHYFASNSRQNTTEAVVHEYNLITTGDFSPDAQGIYNKVKVYGATVGNIPLLYTSEDSASQGIYGVKELKITDTSITSLTQAQFRADYELSINKDPLTIGETTSLGLPTIQPGQQVRISDPLNGLNPGYYTIQKYTHKFSNDEPFQTILTVKKERSSIPKILKKRIKFETGVTGGDNINDLDYSYLFDFSSDIGTHNGTEISINTSTGNGELTWTAINGTWSSPIVRLPSNITSIEPRIEGVSGTVSIKISIDNGSFSEFVSGITTVPSGKDVQIQLTSVTTDPVITSVGFLYSL